MAGPTAIERGFRAPGTGWMVGGSLVGAVGAYLFQVIVGNRLGAEAFAPVSVQWTVLFIVITVVLVPFEQYTTREAARGRDVWRTDWSVTVVAASVAAIPAALFVYFTRDRLFASERIYAIEMAVMLSLYALFFGAKGILAGRRRFKEIGYLLAAESMFRVLVVVGLLAVSTSAPIVAWSMVVAPLVVVLIRFGRPADPGPPRETAVGRFLGAYVAGSAASQILLAAAPLAVAFLGGSATLVSVVFVTFTLFRAPLTLIYAMQGRILAVFVRWSDEGERRRLRSGAAGLAAAGIVLTMAAWFVGEWIGPAIVEALFESDFVPATSVAAWVATGVVAGSFAQLIGQVLVAGARTGRLASAWVSGLMVAVASIFLFAGGGVDVVVSRAFAIGEITAFSAAGVVVLRSHRA